jgi:putative acetyltransferase
MKGAGGIESFKDVDGRDKPGHDVVYRIVAAKRTRVSSGGSEATNKTYRIAPRGDDLAPLADLWVASWQAVMPAIDFAARRDWFCIYLQDIERQGGVTLYAFNAEDTLAGFMLIDPAQFVLEQLCIAPSHFGSGLGAFLLDHAKNLCGTSLSLDVNADNPRALRFYEKHGFRRTGSGINPRSGLPIWHMRWEASSPSFS